MASDLISRAALLAACRGREVKVRIGDDPFETVRRQGAIFKSVVTEAPAVDAVEVVRCKDCAYVDVPRCCPCQLSGFKVTNDWYCPMGVKKDAVD